jgi:hypothetical protein
LRRQPSLRSQLNQIRLWVRQGRTDAWIAHKLDVSIEQLERFKRDHDLLGDEAAPGRPADPLSVPPPDLSLYDEEEEDEDEADEPDDEEPVGSLLDEPEDEEEERPARDRSRDRSRSRSRSRGRGQGRDRSRDSDGRPDRSDAPGRRAESDVETEADIESADDADRPAARRRRRGRRGGRGRRRASSVEATFDHGEDGYGLWLDPAVVDNPIYAEHWAGHRAVEVTIDQDSITIRRAQTDSDDAGHAADDDDEDQ